MFEFLFYIFLGMMIGIGILVWQMEAKLKEMKSDDFLDKAIDLYKEYTIPLNCEKEGDIYYCYNSRDNTFACQGRSLEEITENFRLRFPDYGSYILRECAEKYWPETLKKQSKKKKTVNDITEA